MKRKQSKVIDFYILRLDRKSENWEGVRAWVRTSAYWSTARTWRTYNWFAATFSRTKNKFNSMCFVWVWRTGLWARETVLRLSHKIVGMVCLTWSSKGKVWIQITSTVAGARFLYSTSVLDLATTVCFLDHHDTRFGPKYMAAPEVDLQWSGSDAQSASK